MVSTSERDPRVLWSFWLACGLAATGAVAPPLLAAGRGGDVLGVAIPFGVAAIAMAANALTYPRGKSLATSLYVLAWIAVVYAILRMIAVPLQHLVIGACTTTVESGCTQGFSSPFSGGEIAEIGVGLVTGALSLQVGYFGLRALYGGPRKQAAAPLQPVDAPSAPVAAVTEASVARPASMEVLTAVDPAAAPLTTAGTGVAVEAPPPARKPRTRRPKPQAELPPPPQQAELPPHPEPAELPLHSSTTSTELTDP